MSAYLPERDARFEHASDAVVWIESWNCSAGCRRGAESELELEEFGPGGTCDILARVAVGDGEPVPELRDEGNVVICLAWEPKSHGH
jgi:hypothetical protein